MSKGKIIGCVVGGFVVMIVLMFTLSAVGVFHYSVFAPWKKSVERKVFEETKSYTHGVIMDLAKYKREYDATDNVTERAAIRELVNQRFAEFDKNNIRPAELRQFLVTMRGY